MPSGNNLVAVGGSAHPCTFPYFFYFTFSKFFSLLDCGQISFMVLKLYHLYGFGPKFLFNSILRLNLHIEAFEV